MSERDYMVRPTFQTEWVEKGGLLIVLAFFLGGLAGGLYLVSLFVGFFAGIIAAFLLGAFSGLGYLLHLGKPMKFWMVLLRPKTSWMSRGTIALIGFLFFLAMQIAPTIPMLGWLPWVADNTLILTMAVVSAIVLIAYKGFALGILNAIPFWNTAMMPVVFIVYAILGGAALTAGMIAVAQGDNGGMPLALAQGISALSLVSAAVVLLLYLWISYSANPAVRYSVVQLLKGRAATYFVGGVVVVGLVIPLVLTAIWMFQMPVPLLMVSVVCQIAGVFFVTYSILKAGTYVPTI